MRAAKRTIPDNILKIDDKNAPVVLLVLIIVLAEVVNMLKSIPLNILSNLLGLGSKKTWNRRSDGSDFHKKFSFDQVDSLGQVKAISQEIQNASHAISVTLKKDK